MLARPPPAGLTAPRPVCSPWLLLDDSGWIHRSSVVLKHALRGDLVKSWLRDRWGQSHTHWGCAVTVKTCRYGIALVEQQLCWFRGLLGPIPRVAWRIWSTYG